MEIVKEGATSEEPMLCKRLPNGSMELTVEQFGKLVNKTYLDGMVAQFKKNMDLINDFNRKMLDQANELDKKGRFEPQESVKKSLAEQAGYLRGCAAIARHLQDAMIQLNKSGPKPASQGAPDGNGPNPK